MTRRWTLSVAGGLLLALASCGRGFFDMAQRAPWRHEAEVACLKSDAVKIGIARMDPIEGPGACGMDFPLKVTALGEPSNVLSYTGALRPPAPIPNVSSSDMPQWPPSEPSYAPPSVAPVEAAPLPAGRMRWVTGPPGIDISHERAPDAEPMSINPPSAATAAPSRTLPPTTYSYSPAHPRIAAPSEAAPRAVARPSDVPPDAMVPPGGSAAVPQPNAPQAYNAPDYRPPQRHPLPPLGPVQGPYSPASAQIAKLEPAATLACPIVSALDQWESEGVQPAALRWFGSPVTEIHQIGSYACRDMIGAGTDHISEHAFGNALDISGFTLADGRTITVKNGWHGTPKEQGFLHDVQLSACHIFVTVLAPGYNPEHYNHIHVDLMRRPPGYRPCRPEAIPGAVAAARAHYANRHREPAYTGSIAAQLAKVGVEGSNPFARSKFSKEIRRLRVVGFEEDLIHWRETGAKLVEQQIDGAHGVAQIDGIERRVEFGRAVVARLVAELRRHLPRRNAVLAHPARDGVTDRIGIDRRVQFRRFAHGAPRLVDLPDRLSVKRDETPFGRVGKNGRQNVGEFYDRPEFFGLGASVRIEIDEAVVEIELRAGEFQRGFGAAGGADQDHQQQPQMVGRLCKQTRKLGDLQGSPERLAVIDLDAGNIGNACDLAAPPCALERRLADAENTLHVSGGVTHVREVGDESFKPYGLGRLGNARVAEEIDPVAA